MNKNTIDIAQDETERPDLMDVYDRMTLHLSALDALTNISDGGVAALLSMLEKEMQETLQIVDSLLTFPVTLTADPEDIEDYPFEETQSA